MRILLVATKPPWPPVDGGRVLMCETIAALAAHGHRLTVVAPRVAGAAEARAAAAAVEQLGTACEVRLVAGRSMPLPLAFLRALLAGSATSITRHSRAAVRREVERLLATKSFDVVHAEQIQALPQAAPAFAEGVPVVVRAQNVESDLWAATARRGGFLAPFARRETQQLATWEGRMVGRAAAAVALTADDAARLAELARGRGRVTTVAAPFPARLPPGRRRLAGAPAVVLLGSRGWPPNRDAAVWFADAIWPGVQAALPQARLHLFGQTIHRSADGLTQHPAPAESRDAFPPGAILVVPLRIASGVRIKILEAWARGVSVVATPQAAAGLDAVDGRELLLAADADGFTAALGRLAAEPALAARLTAAGRALLAERHDPQRVARELEEVYLGAGATVAGRAAAASPSSVKPS